jgi:hypothetical protein
MSVRLIVENDGGSLEVIIEDPSQADFDFIGRVAATFNAALAEGPAEGGEREPIFRIEPDPDGAGGMR